jgi:hypothetical protein
MSASPFPPYPAGSILDTSTQISVSYQGVTFQCWDEGTKENLRRDGKSTAVRTILCNWTDRIAIASLVIGGSVTTGGSNIFTYGQPYPDLPAFVCTGFATQGVGLNAIGPNGLVAYQYARCQITYEPNQLQNTGVGYIEIDNQSHYYQLNTTKPSFKWTSGGVGVTGTGVPADQVPVAFIKTSKVTIERETATLNESLYLQLQNNTNSTTIFGASEGQMIFWGAKSRRKVMAFGQSNYTVTLSFEYNSAGWNYLYNPNTKNFESFAYTNGNLLYPESDLNSLLQ